ncbi:MAG: exo-alpha-sialidase [Planctomycetaceae bacterium]|nr:exo-alpha-sialidase [Planctomycetaceae bacterium]
MPARLFLLVFSLLVAPAFAAETIDHARVVSAVRKALPLLVQSSATYQRERQCFACHHQALPVMVFTAADARAVTYDRGASALEASFTHRYFRDRRAQLIKGEGVPGGPYTAGYALLTLAEQRWPRDDTTAALNEYLRVKQQSDGAWPMSSRRPPLEYNLFTSTALSLRALQRRDELPTPVVAACLRKAQAWLAKSTAVETDERAMRLLGLHWSQAADDLVTSAARDLLGDQRDDGGWVQTAELDSDAYATGEALYALAESRQLLPTEPKFLAGIDNLLRTQLADGSWHVKSRSKPFQTYFESDFPHGTDQFISIAATCWATLALLQALPMVDDPLADSRVPVFVAGSEGYHSFRIPALVTTSAGTLLAFSEARKSSRSDTGEINVVLRRSSDSGRTWQPLIVAAEMGEHTIGNPCPVVDRMTGRVHLLLTRNHGQDKEGEISLGTSREPRTVWVTTSDDDGRTWSPLRDISPTTRENDWGWYGTGPGCGIQLASGRLVVPCYHTPAKSRVQSAHSIYSDDHGVTWQRGEACGPNCGESAVAEAHDGSLVMLMRQHPERTGQRHLAISRDGGVTWTKPEKTLVDPGCQGSMAKVPAPDDGLRPWIAFANPASDKKRERLTLRLSPDLGATWPRELLLDSGPSAYSSLSVLADGSLGCLYERGEKNAYETVSFVRVKDVPILGSRK